MNNLDTQILLALNGDGGPVVDFIFWCLTNIGAFIAYALLLLFLLYKKSTKKAFYWGIAALALVVLCCDQTATQFKHFVPFLRPTHTPGVEELLHTVNDYKGGLYGTVSGHAANIFGLAIFGMLSIRRRWFVLFSVIYALAVAYSRTYLGVHFPSQTLFGIVTGLFWGTVVYKLYSFTLKKYAY